MGNEQLDPYVYLYILKAPYLQNSHFSFIKTITITNQQQ